MKETNGAILKKIGKITIIEKPTAILVFLDNKEIIFEKGENPQSIVETVILHGKRASDDQEDYWIPEYVYKEIRKLAIEKLTSKNKINKILISNNDIRCPNCGYLDPFLKDLRDARKIKGVEVTCPNCEICYRIPDDRPLVSKKRSRKEKKDNLKL